MQFAPNYGTHLDIVGQQPVEQVYVDGTEVSQVLEFLNWRLLHF